MKLPPAALLAALLLAGCRTAQPTANPFLRTTVAPPATGQGAVVVPGEPYAASAPVVTTPAAPAATAPPIVAPAPGAAQPLIAPPVGPQRDKYSPPGGSYIFHQSSNDRSRKADAVDEQVVLTAAAGAPSEKSTVEFADARSHAASGAIKRAVFQDSRLESTAGEGERAEPASETSAVRFVGESPSRVAASGDRARRKPSGSGNPTLRLTAGDSGPSVDSRFRDARDEPREPSSARLVAGSAEVDASTTAEFVEHSRARRTLVQTAFQPGNSRASASDYAHSPDYRELRGRLEYSQSLRQWKLRYIPIDGQTDAYGGSVVLADSPALAQYQPGDLVAARGSVTSEPTGAAGFSPRYQLMAIEAAR